MTSSVFSESSSSPLPSGSRWGPKEVAKVRFADDPEDHELREFACKINDSEELSEVRKRLAEIVAVPEEDLKNKDVTREFSQHSRFFGDLAEVLEKPQSPRTPRRSFTRNTKDFDESDDNESTVPGSSPPVSGLQAPTTPSTPSTVGPEAKKQRLVSPETPTPSRLQPNLPTIEDKCREISSPTIARSPEPARTTAEEYEHRRSTAQLLNPQSTPLNSDSTYDQQSTPSSVGSELPAARFQTKTSEQVVNIMFRNFLHVICDEHGNRNGMEFRVREAESLSIPTKGDFPVAIPDWAVSVSLNGHKHVNILDYEVRPRRINLVDCANNDRENANLRKRNMARQLVN